MNTTKALHIPSTAATLPERWHWSRLDDACEGVFDCPHSTPVLTEDGPLIVRSQDIRSGVIRIADAGRVSEATYLDRVRKAEPRHGDLLYSREGTYFGTAAEVPRDVRVCLGQRMVLIRPKPDVLNFRYLRFWLNSPILAQHIHGHRDGTVAERLNLPTIRGLAVAVPPMLEQQGIACILGSLDDKIELNRRMNETLEAMARAVFRSWFVDFDPVRAKVDGRNPEGMDAATAKLFPDKFEDSPIGPIPKGWRVGRLGEVAVNPRRGIDAADISPGTAYIALEHMPRKSISLSNWESAPEIESNKFCFKRGEILFGKLRPYFHKVGVAPIDGVCSTDILVVAPKSADWFGFTLCHFSSDELVKHADATSTGTKMPRTNWSDLAKYEVVLPDEKIARRFNTWVKPIVNRIIAGVEEGRTLAAARDALLPKLLSGEVSVPDAEQHLGRAT
jgi:type I restriction enzyme S subunit